jgi:competence protein ComEA
MKERRGGKVFGLNRVLLIAGLVGLSLIFGGVAVYAQVQKALIDLNSASEKELESLKGIGPATAKKIIDGRPYKSVDDLTKAGIPAKTIEGIKAFVKVGPAKAAAPAAPAKAPVKEEKAKAPVAKASAPAAPAKEPAAKTAPTPAAPAKEPTAKSAPTPAVKAPAAAKLAPGQKVNLNTATKAQLEALPEIGPVKAQAIIDGRPYKKADDVMKVKGIKEGTLGKIKDLITVE